MANFINLTPHVIRLNTGEEFSPSGTVARISCSYSDFDQNGICTPVFGQLTGIPDAVPGTYYIVSGMVLGAVGSCRADCVAPCTGHPSCVRRDGQVYSVPGFSR